MNLCLQLAAWMRVRYPSVIDGAIAASAPVGAFVSRLSHPPFDPSSYWKVCCRLSHVTGSAPREVILSQFSTIFKGTFKMKCLQW